MPAESQPVPTQEQHAAASSLWQILMECRENVDVHGPCGPLDHLASALARQSALATEAALDRAAQIVSDGKPIGGISTILVGREFASRIRALSSSAGTAPARLEWWEAVLLTAQWFEDRHHRPGTSPVAITIRLDILKELSDAY